MTQENGSAEALPLPAASVPCIADESTDLRPVAFPLVASGRADFPPPQIPGQSTPASAPGPAEASANPSVAASLLAEERETDGTVDSTVPRSQAHALNATPTENVYGGYTAVAAFPPLSQTGINTAGPVANHVSGPVTIAPTIRLQDVLNGSPEHRIKIRTDRSYVSPREWNQAWNQAVGSLPDNRVIIVIAPRGYGSTTFSLRLLACHAAENAKLIRLEADWKSPKVGKLPLQKDHAYQVDLQDPDHDRFDTAFLNGLGNHSANLKALGSYLVLTIASELWPGHHGQVPQAVNVVHLNDPPDALQLVEQHLTARNLGGLVPYVREASATRHIHGRDAVQAMRAVDIVVRQWNEHRHRQDFEVNAIAVADMPEPWQPNAELDPGLKHAIEQALGDWQDDLDKLFDELGRDSNNSRPLSPEDRCLLLSLAMHQTGTATEVESAALALEQALAKGAQHPTANSRTADTWNAFSRRGLRPRLRAFQAAIDGRDRVMFNRPGYAEAVLAYVWANYGGLRDDLIAWMVNCATAATKHMDPATQTLTSLILRLQDAERLASLRESAINQGNPDVIIHVMAAAAADEHMGRRSRSLLYEWASQRPEVQHIVIAACRELIGTKKDAALVRLRRVAKYASDPDVRTQVLAGFRDVAASRMAKDHFADAVAAWQRDDAASNSVKLGLLALLDTESDGIPWIPSDTTAIDVTAGLREVLTDLSFLPLAVPILVGWLKSCTQDEATYASSLRLMADAARDRHAFSAGMDVMSQLANVRTPDGGSVGQDLFAQIGQREMWSLSSLIRPER